MSNGDADAVRALLAEGAYVNERAPGGQTALILAAIFGHVEIARLLLAAGADMGLQDNLGLTAKEWADRRASSEVVQLLTNASSEKISPSPEKSPAKQARPRVEAEPRNPASEAKPTPQQDAPSGTQEQLRTKPDPDRGEAEQERRASATETKIAPQDDGRRWIQGQLRIIAEQERRKAEETRRSPATETKIGSQQNAPSVANEQQTTKPEPQRRKAEETRRSPATETKIGSQQNAPSVTNEQQTTKPEPQRREVEKARRAFPIEIKIAPQQNAPSVANEQQTTKAEPQNSELERARRAFSNETKIAPQQNAPSGANEPMRMKPQPARVKAEEAPAGTQSARTAARVERAAMLEPNASESLTASPIQRCPKCNTTYKSDLLGYCSYDATKLVSADDPLFNSPAAFAAPAAPPANDWARATVWALLAIMIVSGGSIGYLINNYLFRENGSSAPIAAQMEQSENVRKTLPKIDGALSGMEINVPEPEYPVKAKAEGVSGTVTVRVQVNKRGRVVSARSSSGDWRLRVAAVEAAQKATFSAEKLAGRGAIGTITYVFRL